jgi:hypothetical protein
MKLELCAAAGAAPLSVAVEFAGATDAALPALAQAEPPSIARLINREPNVNDLRMMNSFQGSDRFQVSSFKFQVSSFQFSVDSCPRQVVNFQLFDSIFERRRRQARTLET